MKEWKILEPAKTYGGHLVDHFQHHELRSNNTLFVVVPVSNVARYQSRYRLARQCIAKFAATPNVKVIVVEAAYGDRQHELVDLCKEIGAEHLPLRINSEIWIKENQINLGVRYAIVKFNAKYVGWNDADVEFDNPGWAQETLHQLQHYPILQPWQGAINMSPTGGVGKSFNSVGEQIRRRVDIERADGREHHRHHRHHKHHRHHHHPYSDAEITAKRYNGDPVIFGHCGYAWACRRDFWEHVGGLIEFAILGSADHHMALGARGFYSHSVHSAMKGPFMDECHAWQRKAMQYTHGRVGYVDGFIKHFHHGPMERRNYVGRWEILIKHDFNPHTDLRKDGQGVITLVGKPKLEHAIQEYNRNRQEDSIEEY